MRENIEFIESYTKDGYGDYRWNGNRGELIRCKDCKRWNTKDGMFKDFDERQWHKCPHLGIDTEEYFYCSEAERKEE